MQIIFIKFLFAVLASWRICHLLSDEDGPWDVIFKIRKQLGQGFFGSLLDCFYCLSIWVAIPFALWLSDNLKDGIVSWLAISGGACIIYKASSKK
jgi:hypothetical protein